MAHDFLYRLSHTFLHSDKSSQFFQLPQGRTGINRLGRQPDTFFPVSYTHLTLPTIYSV